MDKKEIYSKLLYSTIDHEREGGLYDDAQLHEVVRHLIELGADVNYITEEKYPWSLLHCLISTGYFELIKTLLEAGIDIEVKDYGGGTALFRAADRADFDLAQFLIENGADINTRDNSGRTILHVAVKDINTPKRIELIKLLIAKGLDVNAKDSYGRTPLHMFCCNTTPCFPHLEVIELLIELGADVNAQDDEGRTPPDMLQYELSTSSVVFENYEKVLSLLQGEKNDKV